MWPDSPASSAASFNDIEIDVVGADSDWDDRSDYLQVQRRSSTRGPYGAGIRSSSSNTATIMARESHVEREGVTILTNDYDEVDALLHSICKFVCPHRPSPRSKHLT
jgi:hypothetical protein